MQNDLTTKEKRDVREMMARVLLDEKNARVQSKTQVRKNIYKERVTKAKNESYIWKSKILSNLLDFRI